MTSDLTTQCHPSCALVHFSKYHVSVQKSLPLLTKTKNEDFHVFTMFTYEPRPAKITMNMAGLGHLMTSLAKVGCQE